MTTPARIRREFPGISTRAWEHPADRTALVGLRQLSGFDTLLRTLSGLLQERQHRLMYLATAVRVDERQFKNIHQLREDAVKILDAPRSPEMFVLQHPSANSFTIGMDRPFIVLTTGLLDLLDPEELRFVVGHELGHALSGHAVYRTMLMHLMRLAANIGWMPVGGWALRAIVAALMEWSRKSELSGDRAGLLVGQDVEASVRVHMKLAGGSRVDQMSHAAFLEQADAYDRAGDLRDGVLKLLNLELQTHPFSVLRAAELRRWIASGDYDRMLDGQYPRREQDKEARLSEEIKHAARAYRENFEQSEDPLIRTVRNLGRDFGETVGTVGQEVSETLSKLGKRIRGSDD
ncbi:M48 family metallopeptidase [Nocardia sp. CDC160]|uniref:M48 family metallopeptidase n=1 Tax=Nocardia sp. CDC160 TaxID=3112166 RepID=UPI002DB65E1C|nr:M48 family metallopeptidase [Nocardia sp. CDC160]MEC3915279.1 M48 family metallopeptidase [Nocardia sp. CDC160]